MSPSVTYLHLKPEAALPKIDHAIPARMVVVVEAEVSAEWQSVVSAWIILSGCLYMMAWGFKCSSWDDSVDIANIEKFKFGEIPKNHFAMTTWHTDESLAEVFWYSKNNAFHPTVELRHTVLLHISAESKEREFLSAYAKA